jgi:hypothetical protein
MTRAGLDRAAGLAGLAKFAGDLKAMHRVA